MMITYSYGVIIDLVQAPGRRSTYKYTTERHKYDRIGILPSKET
jgi:hypothetical protein